MKGKREREGESQSWITKNGKKLCKKDVIERFRVIKNNKENVDNDISNFIDPEPFIMDKLGKQIAFPFPDSGSTDKDLVELMERCNLKWKRNPKCCRFIVGTEMDRFESIESMTKIHSSFSEFKLDRGENNYITPIHLIRFIEIDFSRSLSKLKNEEIFIDLNEDQVSYIESDVSTRRTHTSFNERLIKKIGKLFN